MKSINPKKATLGSIPSEVNFRSSARRTATKPIWNRHWASRHLLQQLRVQYRIKPGASRRHKTGDKPTPNVGTLTKHSPYSMQEIIEGTKQVAAKSTSSIATPIVTKLAQDSDTRETRYDLAKRRQIQMLSVAKTKLESTRHDAGKSTPSVRRLKIRNIVNNSFWKI